MKKVLITGGAGFIGCHLSRHLLACGYAVDIADNFSRGVLDTRLEQLKSHENCRLFHIDLLDAEAVKQMGTDYHFIFHLAAILGVQNVIDNPYTVLSQNVLSMFEVITLAKSQKCLERLVFSSTSEVYAGTLKDYGMTIPTPEFTPLTVGSLNSPRTSYMLSKIYCEALCIHSHVPYTNVRFHNVYGPRMGLSHVIPQLLQKVYALEANMPLDVFSPGHTRAFCYVDDVVEMLKRIIETPACANHVYNVGNGEREISVKDLSEIIISTVGKPVTVNLRENTPGSPERRVPDTDKLTAAIGRVALTGLEDGVRKTFEWYKENVFDSIGISAV